MVGRSINFDEDDVHERVREVTKGRGLIATWMSLGFEAHAGSVDLKLFTLCRYAEHPELAAPRQIQIHVEDGS